MFSLIPNRFLLYNRLTGEKRYISSVSKCISDSQFSKPGSIVITKYYTHTVITKYYTHTARTKYYTHTVITKYYTHTVITKYYIHIHTL